MRRDILFLFSFFFLFSNQCFSGENYYIYGGSQKVGRVDKSGNIYYYVDDHLDSARVILKEDQTMEWSSDYQPFGQEVNVQANGGTEDKTFSGKEHDQTGLFYYGARYYDPAAGRFTSPDPAREFASSYAYVGNNPLNRIDPYGKRSVRGIDRFRNRQKMQSVYAKWEEDYAVWLAQMEVYEKGKKERSILRRLANELNYPGAAPDFFKDYFYPLVLEKELQGVDIAPLLILGGDLASKTMSKITLSPSIAGGHIHTAVAPNLTLIDELSIYEQNSIEYFTSKGRSSGGGIWPIIGRLILAGEKDGNNLFILREQSGAIRALGFISSEPLSFEEVKGAMLIEFMEGLGSGAGSAMFYRLVQESINRGFNGIAYANVKASYTWFRDELGLQERAGFFHLNREEAEIFLKDRKYLLVK